DRIDYAITRGRISTTSSAQDMAKPKHGAAKRSGKQAKPTAKPAKAKPAKKAIVKKAAPKSALKNKSKIPAVKKAAPAKKPKDTLAPHKSAPASHTPAAHDTPRAPHQPARKQHARPTGGVAARLSVGAAAEQTITREDGRYALPATVNIELPKG